MSDIALGRKKNVGRNLYKESTYSLTVTWISLCLTWIFGECMERTFEFPTAKPGMQKKISRGKAFFHFATNHLAQASLCTSLLLMSLISVLIKLHSHSGSHKRQCNSLQKRFRWEVKSRRVMEEAHFYLGYFYTALISTVPGCLPLAQQTAQLASCNCASFSSLPPPLCTGGLWFQLNTLNAAIEVYRSSVPDTEDGGLLTAKPEAL